MDEIEITSVGVVQAAAQHAAAVEEARTVQITDILKKNEALEFRIDRIESVIKEQPTKKELEDTALALARKTEDIALSLAEKTKADLDRYNAASKEEGMKIVDTLATKDDIDRLNRMIHNFIVGVETLQKGGKLFVYAIITIGAFAAGFMVIKGWIAAFIGMFGYVKK